MLALVERAVACDKKIEKNIDANEKPSQTSKTASLKNLLTTINYSGPITAALPDDGLLNTNSFAGTSQ